MIYVLFTRALIFSSALFVALLTVASARLLALVRTEPSPPFSARLSSRHESLITIIIDWRRIIISPRVSTDITTGKRLSLRDIFEPHRLSRRVAICTL